MKKLTINFTIVSLMIIGIFGFTSMIPEKFFSDVTKTEDKNLKVVAIFKPEVPGNHVTKIYIYEIDGCEYIGSINKDGQGDWLSHKGNCKFCKSK